MRNKALEQWQIDDIVKQKGKQSSMQLSMRYHVHRKTIENYWRQHLLEHPEQKARTIRVISTTAGKVRNYIIDKIYYEKLWTILFLNDQEIAKIWNNNIFAIEPVKEG